MNRVKIARIAITLALCAAFACGCGERPNTPPPATGSGTLTLPDAIAVDISDGNVHMPYEISGARSEIVWKSANSTVAVVASDLLIPVSEGETVITATMNGEASACKVFVTDEYSAYTVIRTAEQFIAVTKSRAYTGRTKKYCLGNDIDFGGAVIEPMGGWDADGKTVTGHNFNATFDGRGYALKNFRIENPESCIPAPDDSGATAQAAGATLYFGVSLFPRVQYGTIRNLNLIGVDFDGYGFTGGIAGICEAGIIENCYVRGKINATGGYTDSVPAGGICGIMGKNAVVANCFVDLEIGGGFVFCGFNFGYGRGCNAVTELLAADMPFQTDSTGKDNPDEDKQLTAFRMTENKRLEATELDDLDNYAFDAFENPADYRVKHKPFWAVADGYKAFIPRPDGKTPSWAML